MSFTRSVTGTKTFGEQVVRVTRDVQTDFLRIAELYPRQCPESEARAYISDIRLLMDEELLLKFEVQWLRVGTLVVVDALRYEVHNGKVSIDTDRPGGFQYNLDCAVATFDVITWRDWGKFNDLPEKTRNEINAKLKIKWVTVPNRDYSLGSWKDDLNYVQPDVSIGRLRFQRQ